MRVEVSPDLLRWALERAGAAREERLLERFPRLAQWEEGTAQPTLKQLESFARAACVPIGFMFLEQPPEEPLPIPDLRTVADRGIDRPSPDLLDTIYLCQQRQAWYRDYARRQGEPKRGFVGAAGLDDAVEPVAADIRQVLGLDLEERRQLPTWTDALRRFVRQADELGVLVMINGVVGSNNNRKLDPEEFRGFALADAWAPLVFINGADSKAAQMFTLAHELAHLWLGESALSDLPAFEAPAHDIERWCNRVAAELLVPRGLLAEEYRDDIDLAEELGRLARRFKVSTLVILRSLHDLGALDRETLWQAYREQLERMRPRRESDSGNYYLTQAVRLSRRFARALIVDTFEGQTGFAEATRLVGTRKVETLRRFGRELGIGEE